MKKVKKSRKSSRGYPSAEGSIIPGLVISSIFFVLGSIFAFVLVRSRLLPNKYLVLGVIALVVFTALIAFLTHRTSKKARFIIGLLLSCLLALPLVYGTIAISKVTNTLSTITTTKTEVTKVGVYVLSEDPAKTLNDLTGNSFGILALQERETTDKAIEQVNNTGVQISTMEYSGPSTLIDGLYNKECRAVVLNTAYLDVLEETEGYADVRERIREVAMFDIEEEASDNNVEAISDKQFTLYISGIDSRNGLTAKSRSDVNILATVNTETRQILLVTTPRDYFVELPISNGAKDKLTHAGIYGVDVSMGTMAMLYGIDSVDYYFRISFEGTVDIVNALGGVSVYSEYPFTAGGHTFVQGYNNVNGEQALSFARERYAFESGDRQRGKNQTALIKAIIDKASSPEILVNYNSILTAVEGNFETSLPYDLIAGLVSDQLSSGQAWDVISYSVDGAGASEVPYSMSVPAYVMIPDEATVATAKGLMQSVLNGEIINQP